MVRVLAALLALIAVVVVALLALLVLEAVDLASCSDADVGEDCIEGSSAERIIGLVLGFGALAGALATLGLAVVAARRGRGIGRVLACALATAILALGALYFLPVSF